MIPELRVKTNKCVKEMLLDRCIKEAYRAKRFKRLFRQKRAKLTCSNNTITELYAENESLGKTIYNREERLAIQRDEIKELNVKIITAVNSSKRFKAERDRLKDKLKKSQGTG
jgi:uncharacterized coiled-coil protein SlyX